MGENLINQQFGHLTVIARCGTTKLGQSIWTCQCVCGQRKDVRGYHLKGKKIRSCGCLKKETVNIKWQGAGQVARWLWNRHRISAKRRKLVFTVTAQDMWDVALKQNLKCALSGDILIFVNDQKNQCQANASLDRIDSSKGYEVGNIQWVTKDVNMAKHVLPQSVFIALCKRVTERHG